MNPYGRPVIRPEDRVVRLENGEIRYRFGRRLVRESELREAERLKAGLGVSRPRRLRATNYYPIVRRSGGSRRSTEMEWHCRTSVEWRRKWSRQAWDRVEGPEGRVVWFWHEQRARKNVLHVMRQTTVTGGQAMPDGAGVQGAPGPRHCVQCGSVIPRQRAMGGGMGSFQNMPGHRDRTK
jgi:hypothetical protein